MKEKTTVEFVLLSKMEKKKFSKKRVKHFLLEDSFTIVIYLPIPKSKLRERRMEKDSLVSITQVTCDHTKQRQYIQTRFDILSGFKIVLTRCINCHKIIAFKAETLN